MRRRAERLGAAALVGGLAVAVLTACVPQSREGLDRYVEALDAVPGVDIDYYGVTNPLPFSIQGNVGLSLDADQEVLHELTRIACEHEKNAIVAMSIAARAGLTRVRLDGVDLCAGLSVDVVGLAIATQTSGVELGVGGVPGTRVAVAQADDLAETLAVLRVAAGFLPEGPVQLTSDAVSLRVAELPLAVAYLDDLGGLVAAHGVVELALEEDSLVVQVSPASEVVAVRDAVARLDAARYATLEVVVTDAGAGGVPAGTDAAVVELRDRVVAELGLSTTIGGNTVYVQAADSREVVELSERIAAVNPDAVRVGIAILEDTEAGVAAFRQDPAPELTADHNPYPQWAAQYDRLIVTELVRTVEVGPGSLEAWLSADGYDDREAFAAVRAVLDGLAAEYDLTRWGLNNRDLSGG